MAKPANNGGLHRVGDLEIEQDLAFERRQNLAQRIAWAIGALILLAAMLGAFGDGPLARATRRSDDGRITVCYQRLARDRAPDRLRVEVAASAIRDGRITIGLAQTYLEKVRIQTITPSPLSTGQADGQVRFLFAAADAPLVVYVDLEHDGAGSTAGEIRVYHDGRHSSVAFTQFIYP